MTQQEVIYAFMQSLNKTQLSGRAAVDEAIQASSSFNSLEEVKRMFINDQKAAKNWHTFLVEKCGIILDNADTGAISGSDAGGVEKTAKTIIPSTGEAQYPEGTSFTVDGLTIYGIPAQSQLTEAQQYVVQGLYSWWIKDSLALIKESYGFSFTDADTTNSRLKLKFVYDTKGEYANTLAYVSFDSDDWKEWESRVLCVNMAFFDKMDLTDPHGTTDYGTQLDRTLVHELVHGIMASNVNYFYDLPIFLKEGGSAELIHGIDDERRHNIIAYAQDFELFGKILAATFVENCIEVYAGGYMFMRYFAKQAATDTTFDYDTYRETVSVQDNFATNYWDVVTMQGSASKDTITNSGHDVFITAGAAADIIKNYSAEKVTINGGNGNDSINNDGVEASIIGGNGADSIENSGGDATILGGVGKDFINNSGANSSISGGAGNDAIINEISDYEIIDEVDLTLYEPGVLAGTNSVVVLSKGTASLSAYSVELIGGNKSDIYGDDGNDAINNTANQARIYGDDGEDILFNYGYNSTVYGGADNDSILNSTFTESIDAVGGTASVSVSGYASWLYGGSGNDSINNECGAVKIYGQTGNDYILNGGANVSVYGGAGADYVKSEGATSYISLGDGADEIHNVANTVKALGGAGADNFLNEGEYATLLGDAGNDNFVNFADFVTMSGGAGADSIYSSGEAASINGGNGSDFVYNEGVNVSIFGGAGADLLYNEGDHVTIRGGAGNDSIVNSGGKHIVYQFGKGGGTDTVVGVNANDTIKITSGSYSASRSGSNVIVKVGSDTMTLLDGVNKAITFITSAGKVRTRTFTSTESANVAPMWFADDNNFTTSDNNISALVENNSASYSAAELDYSSDLTSLVQKNNLITYSGKK